MEVFTKISVYVILCLGFLTQISLGQQNPVFPGWYADPEGIIYENQYWIYPTYSAPAGEQTFFDAFSSPDFVNWTKHSRIIDTTEVKWARMQMWAPAVFKRNDKYYFLFAANNVHPGDLGGIGIAVADRPEGPYKDLIGKPLVNDNIHGAQPIDQYVFRDVDDTYYMYYGGWGVCNVVKLNANFTGLVPFSDGFFYKEVTPTDYVEGPFMFIRNGIYYFMWSEGGWTGPDYRVAYAMANSPLGPFERVGVILQQDPAIAILIHRIEWRRRLGDFCEKNSSPICISNCKRFKN